MSEIPNVFNEALLQALTEEDPDIEEIQQLLEKGADPNFVLENADQENLEFIGNTPLFVAAMAGQKPEILELLIQYGADLNYINKSAGNMTFLIALTFGENEDSLRHFLQKKEVLATLNTPFSKNATALSVAADNNAVSLVELLLSKGAYPFALSPSGHNLLHDSIVKQQWEILELLLKQTNSKQHAFAFTEEVLNSVLHFSAWRGFTKAVQLLAEKYHVKNLPDLKLGSTLLESALYGGNAETIQWIRSYFGSEEAQRKKDPEAAVFRDRANRCILFAHVMGLDPIIKVKKPHSQEFASISTKGNKNLSSITFLNDMLKKYLNTATLDDTTKRYFEQIQATFAKTEGFLKQDGTVTTKHLLEDYYKHQLVGMICGWKGHALFEVLFKSKYQKPMGGIVNRGQGMEDTGSKVYYLKSEPTAQYLASLSTKDENSTQFTMLPEIVKIMDTRHAKASLPTKAHLKDTCSLSNSKASVEVMLYYLRLEDLLEILNSKETAEIEKLNKMGIYNAKDAHQAALLYARSNYKLFTYDFRNLTLKDTLDDYKNEKTSEEDKRILRDLMEAYLKEHHGQPKKFAKHNRTHKIKAELKRAHEILNALTSADLKIVLQNLSNDNIDLLTPLLKENDKAAIKLISENKKLVSLALQNAVKNDDSKFLSEILQIPGIKQHINEADSQGDTLLTYSVHTGNKDLFELLLSHGADPSHVNAISGETLAVTAARAKKLVMVEPILQAIKRKKSETKRDSDLKLGG